MKNLLEYLRALPVGPILDSKKLEGLLAVCWEEFLGSEAEGMEARKLHGRMEEVQWDWPELTFTIERHGGTVMGSSRAELLHWTLDVDTRTATCGRGGRRQLRTMSPRLEVDPLAAEIAGIILERKIDERIKWNDDSVRVLIGKIIPDSGPKQTVSDRRSRFRRVLDNILARSGWPKVRSNVYRPPPPSKAAPDRSPPE